ncbi:hypothetical protein C9374_002620 [Naegleria lovaniensis]|uniref:ADP/ATP translocase n=1 Tax=Naegleria lovaniensis TaxID=51637 RepID=A0AA88GU43_NAELO|nr:uncharacterized protein C9374_002620 [Naegleria lovaniensis]KAG2386174.1 hypothetical protein C9374_002620 [Naegleria lovaniensis]
MPEQHTTSPSSTYTFLKDFTLGGASGAVAKTITAPIERVRIVLQTSRANPEIIRGEIPPFKGIMDCFVRLAREQGIKSYWNGNFTNVIRYYPTQAIALPMKDVFKKLFPKYDPKTEFGKFFLVQMVSGSLSGLVTVSLVYPLDYARTRLTADIGKVKTFNGLTDCLVKTAKGPNGFLGLYPGFTLSMLTSISFVPFRFLYFGFYDTLREFNPYHNDSGTKGFLSRFVIAQTTSIASSYISYPLDTVVKRLQMQGEKPREQWVYKGTLDCFKKILRQEGWRSFFDGAGALVLRSVGSALVLVLYDQLQDYYKKGEKEETGNE